MNIAGELNKVWRELKALRAELSARARDAGSAAPAPAEAPEVQLLSLQHAAERLACSSSTIRRMVRRGELAAVLVGATPKIPLTELRRISESATELPQVGRKKSTRPLLPARTKPGRPSVAEEKARLAVLRAARKPPVSQQVREALQARRRQDPSEAP